MATNDQISAYYSNLVTTLGRAPDVDVVAVAHMVPNTLSFAPAVHDLARLAAILPKPKSRARTEHSELEKQFRLIDLDRNWTADAKAAAAKLRSEAGVGSRPFVLVDIGGYFSESLNALARDFGGALLGVLEGTENGVHKYEECLKANGGYDVPVVTVARSPLKLPEDYLVASSIVFSIESTLRQEAEILQTRSAAVIGYGRVGSAVAEILRGRGISTVVHDSDPIKLADAAARGFKAFRDRTRALEHASLVVCATGNQSLDLRGFGSLVHGSVVASVTSADDEFDLESLAQGYEREQLSQRLTRFKETRNQGRNRQFLLIADGNAANFLDGAVIGPAMQLIEGEKLAAIRALIDRELPCSGFVSELTYGARSTVAEIWNHHFLRPD